MPPPLAPLRFQNLVRDSLAAALTKQTNVSIAGTDMQVVHFAPGSVIMGLDIDLSALGTSVTAGHAAVDTLATTINDSFLLIFPSFNTLYGVTAVSAASLEVGTMSAVVVSPPPYYATFPPTPPGTSGLSGGAIAGIVVGSVLFVALLGLAGFIVYKRRQQVVRHAGVLPLQTPSQETVPPYADQ